jgi:uncharacterized protein YecE (DUF72 family)
MFYCGTCGFSYADWVGIYYPERLPRKDWLGYYAQEFNSLELNTTYYALPPIHVMQSLAQRTGSGFRFAVKASQDMTHNRRYGVAACEAFIKVLHPLIDAGKLGCVLVQFPYSFGCHPENRSYLEKLYYCMPGLPMVIEFRNSSWLNPQTLDWMRENNIAFCCVDEPQLPRLLPPLAEVTGEIGYVRFHGRNGAKWWNPDHPWERYDYTYSPQEIEEWKPRIEQIARAARDTFIFANNHWKSQAVDTIRQVRSMLDQLVL